MKHMAPSRTIVAENVFDVPGNPTTRATLVDPALVVLARLARLLAAEAALQHVEVGAGAALLPAQPGQARAPALRRQHDRDQDRRGKGDALAPLALEDDEQGQEAEDA